MSTVLREQARWRLELGALRYCLVILKHQQQLLAWGQSLTSWRCVLLVSSFSELEAGCVSHLKTEGHSASYPCAYKYVFQSDNLCGLLVVQSYRSVVDSE